MLTTVSSTGGMDAPVPCAPTCVRPYRLDQLGDADPCLASHLALRLVDVNYIVEKCHGQHAFAVEREPVGRQRGTHWTELCLGLVSLRDDAHELIVGFRLVVLVGWNLDIVRC